MFAKIDNDCPMRLHWSKVDVRWYLGVRCQKCKFPIIFGLDHSSAAESTPRQTAQKLFLTCTAQECGFRADYTGASILRLQKSADNKNDLREKNESVKGRKN